MKALILIKTGEPLIDGPVQDVRCHSPQFGGGREFTSWVSRMFPALQAIYTEETGRVEIFKSSGYSPFRSKPLAVWAEGEAWSLGDGRTIRYLGQSAFGFALPNDSVMDISDADKLARRLVTILNQREVSL